MEKLVSVYISAYNAEEYILDSVNSVLNQTYRNIQLIVVDDCSTDNTLKLLDTVSDSRLEVYPNATNMNMAYSWNEGIKRAKGDYLAHIDADDIWYPEKLEKQVRFLESNPEYGACFSHADMIDSHGELCNEQYSELKVIFAMHNLSKADMFKYFIENPNRLCHNSMIARADVIERIGHYNVANLYLNDYEYWLRMMLDSPIYIIEEPLVKVRQHGDNNSNMSEDKWIAHDNELLRAIENAIHLCPDDFFLEAFKDRLHFQGVHTHKEVELEKALYLAKDVYRFKDNPILAVDYLRTLFNLDKDYIALSTEKFGFTLKDFYNLQSHRLYADSGLNELIENQKPLIKKQGETVDDLLKAKAEHDRDYKTIEGILKEKDNTIREMGESINNYHNTVIESQKSYADLGNQYNELQSAYLDLSTQHNDLQAVYLDLSAKHNDLNNKYNAISNSFFWKITLPLRKFYSLFKKSQ